MHVGVLLCPIIIHIFLPLRAVYNHSYLSQYQGFNEFIHAMKMKLFVKSLFNHQAGVQHIMKKIFFC